MSFILNCINKINILCYMRKFNANIAKCHQHKLKTILSIENMFILTNFNSYSELRK